MNPVFEPEPTQSGQSPTADGPALPAFAASIVICTYRRPELLDACLASLLNQQLPDGFHEILVVDNSTGCEARPVVERWQPFFTLRRTPLRHLLEERSGVAFARNRGVAEAVSPLIVFIDDDETACDGWLDQMTEPFRRFGDGVDIVAGEVEPDFGDQPRPDWLSDDLLQFFSCRWGWDTQPRFLQLSEWFGEGNCAFRKALMTGRQFPTDMGRKSGGLMSNEGVIFHDMRREGAKAYYLPSTFVLHHIHSDRLNRSWLMRRMFFQGVSNRKTVDRMGVSVPQADFMLNLAKLATLNVDTLEGESIRAVAGLYHQIGYAMGSVLHGDG
ncbi:Glycosyl transferase, group 2 family protein [Azospirillum palustre]